MHRTPEKHAQVSAAVQVRATICCTGGGTIGRRQRRLRARHCARAGASRTGVCVCVCACVCVFMPAPSYVPPYLPPNSARHYEFSCGTHGMGSLALERSSSAPAQLEVELRSARAELAEYRTLARAKTALQHALLLAQRHNEELERLQLAQ